MRFVNFLILSALALPAQDSKFNGPSDANPPVSEGDIRIVRRAREIRNSPAKWNRADNRECPATQRTYSLDCALEKATEEVSRKFTTEARRCSRRVLLLTKSWPRATTINTVERLQ